MRFILLLCSFLAAAPAFGEPVWTGTVAWRYLIRNFDDNLGSRDAQGRSTSETTTKAHQIRASLAAAGKGETWDWGFGIRTSSSASSDWLTVQNAGDLNVQLESAFFRLHESFWGTEWAITAGRAKSVLYFDPIGQTLFDKDVRWDGLGWQWKQSSYGLNLAQYVLGARNQGAAGASQYSETDATEGVADSRSGFAYLFSFQPFLKVQVAEEVEAVLAFAYHIWAGTGGSSTGGWFTNAVHGGRTTSSATGSPNVNPILMDNARQWHVFTDWKLPWNLRFIGEYVQNKDVFYGTRANPTNRRAQTGVLGLTLVYGTIREASDWAVSYSYVRKGGASVINAFTNSNMPPDNIGHLFAGSYALEKGFTVGAKVELYKEKARLGGDGLPLSAPNQNLRQTQDRFEFFAGLGF